MNTENVTFLHSGNIGDVWASLPTIKEYCRQNETHKVTLLLEKDSVATYYLDADHPTRDESGNKVMLNEKMIDMMLPLLKEQPYLADARMYMPDEKVNFNLNKMRETYVGMPGFSINRWYFYVFPNLACNTTKAWLTIPDAEKDFAKGKVLITFTERYRNTFIDYTFLKEFEDDCVFVGTMREYNNFTMTFDLNIKKLHIENFLELAQAIKQSKFHLSNQTQAFQLSQGMDTPRILELCGAAPNVIVYGDHAFDFLSTPSLQYYFHYLNGTVEHFYTKLKTPVKDEG